MKIIDEIIEERKKERKMNEQIDLRHIHIVPTQGKKHFESKDCWCNPEMIYKDEFTLIEVWSHKGYEELEQ